MSSQQDVKFRIVAQVFGTQAVDKLKSSVDGVDNSAKGLVSQFTKVKGAIAAAAALFTTGAIANYASQIIDTADSLDELAQKTGTSVEELAAFNGALANAGISTEEFAGSLVKLNQKIVAANAGNNEAQRLFKAIGVSIKDANGQIRPTTDIVGSIADAFASLPNGAEKSAAAVKLFGKSGADLIPFLNDGSEKIRALGLNISEDFAQKAARFNDTLGGLSKSLKNGFIDVLDDVLPRLQSAIDDFANTNSPLTGLIKDFTFLGDAIDIVVGIVDTFVTTFITGLDTIIQSGRTFFNFFTLGLTTINESIRGVMIDLKNLATLNFDNLGNGIGGALDKVNAEAQAKVQENRQIIDSWLNRTEKRIDGFAERTGNRFQRVTDSINGINNATKTDRPSSGPKTTGSFGDLSEDEDAKRLKKELDAAAKFRASQLDAIELEKRKIELSTLSRAEREKELAALKVNQEVAQSSIGLTKQGAAAYRDAGDAIIKAKDALIDFEEQQRESWQVGAQSAVTEYLDTIKDVAGQTKQLFTNAFKASEDAFVSFAKTGKLSFKELADSIVEDLIRISVRQGIIAPVLGAIAGAFSPGASAGAGAATSGGTGYLGGQYNFANGGIMTANGALPLNKYANGGIANSPQLALFGEGRTPEAYVPLPDGRRIPVKVDAQGSGGDQVNVVVNVNMQTGSEATKVNSDSGANLGAVIAQAVKKELIEQKRPGGLLAV